VITVTENMSEVKIIPGYNHFFSVARVNEDGIESLFSGEQFIQILSTDEPEVKKGIELLQNRPNPFDESTMIGFIVHDRPQSDKALITITDTQGQMAQQMTTSIKMGVNEILYDHGYGKVRTYFYNLIIDGKTIDTKKMVFVAF